MQLAIIILTLGLVHARKRHYKELLQDERIEDVFRYLQTADLLRSINDTAGVSVVCARELAIYARAVDQREPWALKMLDSSTKIPSGIQEGNIFDLGNFDECVETRDSGIQGRHCMYAVNPMIADNILPYHPTMSICLPSSCGRNDVVVLVNTAINVTANFKGSGVHVDSANCTSEPAPLLDTEFVIFSSVMTLYIGFLVICTVFDLTEDKESEKKYRKETTTDILARFSLWRNAKKILNTKSPENDLPFVHGIRAMSTAWIILFHEYFVGFFMINANLAYIPEWLFSWRSAFPMLAQMSVDTFFTLSGFLMTYTFIQKMKKGEKFNIIYYYLHRYIRLTLPMAVVVFGLFITFPKIGTGPRFDWLLTTFAMKETRSNWWTSLLYVQNLVARDDFRLLHLWSLCVDMQLFWISPIILYPLYKKPKLGLTILSLILVVCLTVTAVIAGANKYYTALVNYEDIDINFGIDAMKEIYLMPYTRASPWLLGIFLGYIVTKDSAFKFGKKFAVTGWVLTCVGLIVMLGGLRLIMNKNYKYSYIQDVTFITFSRPAWALGTCWLIYACINNVAGPISTFLSLKIFLPLSRISYCVYLVHLLFPSLKSGLTRSTTYFDDYTIFHDYMGDLILSIVFGFFFSLLFEVPMVILDGILFKKKKKPSPINEKTQL